MILYKSCVEVVFGMSVENFTFELLMTLCVAISLFVLNILEISCCWAIRWGVAFPRRNIDVAWTSFGRRFDVVFSAIYHIPYLTIGLLSLKLPPPPCAVLLVSVNQNEAKISAAFRW